MLTKAKLINKRYPNNLTALCLLLIEKDNLTWLNSLNDNDMIRLIQCTKSGLDHPSSELGCYAMQPV